MKQIENFENVKAISGEFARPTAGGYICHITHVKDVPYDETTKKGDYLKIEFDIVHGEFKRYYLDSSLRNGGQWWGNFIRSYKESAQGMFKHFINCVEESNAGYKWDWQEQRLEAKLIGLVLGEEEYRKNDGSIGTRLIVKDIKTVEQIMDGDFKVPTTKKLDKPVTAPASDFVMLDDPDSQLPF